VACQNRRGGHTRGVCVHLFRDLLSVEYVRVDAGADRTTQSVDCRGGGLKGGGHEGDVTAKFVLEFRIGG